MHMSRGRRRIAGIAVIATIAAMVNFGGPAVAAAAASTRAPLSATPLLAPRAAIVHHFVVDDSGDTANAGATGVCADSNGKCTLRAAMDAANSDGTNVDAITVGARTINLTLGALEANNTMFIDGAGSGSTVIDQTSEKPDSVIIIGAQDAPFPAVQIGGLTITGGDGFDGGGVDVRNGALTLTGALVTGNVATPDDGGGEGGGIFNSDNGSLWLQSTTVSKNSAAAGGGIYNDGAAFIKDSVIGGSTAAAANVADQYEGGGMFSSGNLQLVNTDIGFNKIIERNEAGTNGRGGGVFSDGVLTITGGSIHDNLIKVAGDSTGGGFYNQGTASVTGTSFVRNSAFTAPLSEPASNGPIYPATVAGGGIGNGGDLTLTNATVDNNFIGTDHGRATLQGAGISSEGNRPKGPRPLILSSGSLTVRGGSISGNGAGPSEPDVTFADGIANGTTSFSSAGPDFLSSDVSRTIVGAGIPSLTVITGFTDSSHVTLSQNAAGGNNPVTFTIYHGGANVLGGGLLNLGNATVDNVAIEKNTIATGHAGQSPNANTGSGGGIYSEGNFSLSKSSVRENHVTSDGDAQGGGLWTDLATTIQNSFVDKNTLASPGGGVQGGGVFAETPLVVSGSSVSGNTATSTAADPSADSEGGGIWTGDQLIVTKSVVSNNALTSRGSSGGGGIHAAEGPLFLAAVQQPRDVVLVDIEDSTLAGNVVRSSGDSNSLEIEGGAIMSDPPLTAINVTFSGNILEAAGANALASGGAVSLDSNGTFTNSTITGNSVSGTAVPAPPSAGSPRAAVTAAGSQGGGILVGDQSTATFKNTIVAYNSPAASNCQMETDPDLGPSFMVSTGYNLDSGDTCAFHNKGDQINTDPKLGPLQDNTGPAPTHALLNGSPAIDAANNNGCPAADERGVARPIGPACDIGAFEASLPAVAAGGEKQTFFSGYRLTAGDGGVFVFGNRGFYGSLGSTKLNRPIVGGATNLKTFEGYYLVADDGGVFAFGDAPFFGSMQDPGRVLDSPAVDIEPTPTGQGYWIVTARGYVHAFGDAGHFGDARAIGLTKPIIALTITPSGNGYWLVGGDGGIFNYGDAAFYGSMGSTPLNAPIVDLATTIDGLGYYLAAGDGGVFSFGSAPFHGSMGGQHLNAPVIAMIGAPDGSGYWFAAKDGGVFTFGNGTPFFGSMGCCPLNSPINDMIF